MANVAVIGSQWGDEGKGKIVDWLSNRADVVVRFQGGHNAGHTLVIDGVTYKLSLLPSGVVRPGKLSILGNGVVVDPWALLAEIDKIRAMGVDVSPANLRVADNAALILPLHDVLNGNGLKYFSFTQIYAPGGSGGIPQAWTLCIEVTFYAFLPLFALGVRRLGRRRDPLRTELAAVGGLFVLGAMFSVVNVLLSDQDRAFANPWLVALPNWLDTFAPGRLAP